MKIAYLSLGSNVGDRKANLSAALAGLESPEVPVRRVSSIWETEPQGRVAQPWFLNLIAEVETALFPRQLLKRVQEIERSLGRTRAVAQGPRTIDIDIVLFGRFVMNTPELTIPHPRMHERRFVLEPLAELAPDLRHPVSRKTVREMLAEVAGQAARKS